MIQNHEVVGVSSGFLKTFFSIDRALRRVSLARKAVAQGHTNYFFVFNHQNSAAHG